MRQASWPLVERIQDGTFCFLYDQDAQVMALLCTDSKQQSLSYWRLELSIKPGLLLSQLKNLLEAVKTRADFLCCT